jgi:hypothetical protein
MKKLLATAAMLAFVAAANATITASFSEWASGTLTTGAAYTSYRIYVQLSDTPPDEPHGWTAGPDDWTASGLDLDLSLGGGVFYQDALGANPPNPDVFPSFPDAEYDSYYTSPGDYPNTTYSGAVVGIASTADTPTQLDTDWFDTATVENPPGHTAQFVIAQFTILGEHDLLGIGSDVYAARNSGGVLFTLIIPEPGSLALLGLVGLALFRPR